MAVFRASALVMWDEEGIWLKKKMFKNKELDRALYLFP
jgi:hypothetical protein